MRAAEAEPDLELGEGAPNGRDGLVLERRDEDALRRQPLEHDAERVLLAADLLQVDHQPGFRSRDERDDVRERRAPRRPGIVLRRPAVRPAPHVDLHRADAGRERALVRGERAGSDALRRALVPDDLDQALQDARAERRGDELDGELAGRVLAVEDRVHLDDVQRVDAARTPPRSPSPGAPRGRRARRGPACRRRARRSGSTTSMSSETWRNARARRRARAPRACTARPRSGRSRSS